MDNVFVLRITISFFIAGIWIAGATLLAEKLGSRIGGLITNLPSNILISFLFIAFVNDPAFVVNAVPGVPVGMALNTLFLFFFIVLLKYGILLSSVFSMLIWLALAVLVSFMKLENLVINILIYVLITAAAFLILENVLKIPSAEKSAKKYSLSQVIIRAVFAGAVVASVIVMSKFFNPYVTGIISTFPAVLLSTMIILAVNQNAAFARASGKVLVLSSSNIIIYAAGIYFTYNTLGLAAGTIISFICAVAWVWLFLPAVSRLT
jgi:uncharacterized membrane protein (GlpM family)